MEGYQQGGGGKRMGEKVQGIRSIIGKHKIRRGRAVKNSIVNEEAKELICMTHGHELSRGGDAVGRGAKGWRRIKGRKKVGQL